MKLFVRSVDYLSVILVAWICAALIPLQWFWFDPGPVVFSNATVNEPPRLSFTRAIKRPVLMSYQVVVRDIQTNTVICDPASQPFTYRPSARLPNDADLVWWTGGDDRCWPQQPGTYIAETCWTAFRVLWGIVPAKTVCRTSNPFTVSAVSPEEARRAVDQIQELGKAVESLQAD